MVSGTLAPLYTVFGLKLGCSGAAAPIGYEVLKASEACLVGSEACLAGSWALEEGNGRTDAAPLQPNFNPKTV